MRLRGKVAIVTGSSKGIGKAIALKLASEGACVVINQEPIKSLSENVVSEIIKTGGKAIYYDADISVKKDVYAMIDHTISKYNRLDIMVANAGICPFQEYYEIDENTLDRVIDINQKGAFYCAQYSAQKMKELNIRGRLIFISSISAVFGGKSQVHYCGTKGAVNQMMKSFAIALGEYGITSNSIQPGTVLTDINKDSFNANPELLKYFVNRTPIGRLATPIDVANGVCFYATEEAACISGTSLTIDGGMSVNLQ
jgi:L-rhamnose 1-dehydrogenase